MQLGQFTGTTEKYGFERSERWHDHVPDSVLENKDYKMLWDFSVRTDHEIEAGTPDLLIIGKSEKNCQILDVAIPKDGREQKKIRKQENIKILRKESERYGE